jgi:8-oxo-dGTP diphosphatase
MAMLSFHLVVAALIRLGEEVLLVQQQGPHDPHPTWALPGGVVESGELLSEALFREVYEETGLQVREIGNLVYVVQVEGEQLAGSSLAFVFDVSDWQGEITVGDPAGLVRSAGFVPLKEAISRLEMLPWRAMSQPVAAYLKGEAVRGATWLYRLSDSGEQELVAVLPATSSQDASSRLSSGAE